MPKPIQQIFALKFTGNIWKIHYDEIAQVMVLEIRDADTFQTTFAAIQLPDFQILWQDFRLQEPWWAGISAVSGGMMYVHFFPDSQKPESREILAIDVYSRQSCWHSPIHQFYRLDNQGLIAGKWQANEWVYELLDKKNGQIIQTNLIIKNEENSEKEPKSIVLPHHYSAQTAYFNTIEVFFKEGLNIEIVQAVDYLEIADYILIAYFLQKNAEFQNNLLILDTNAQILLHTIINQQSAGLASENFLLINHQLIFIKEKNELIAYQL